MCVLVLTVSVRVHCDLIIIGGADSTASLFVHARSTVEAWTVAHEHDDTFATAATLTCQRLDGTNPHSCIQGIGQVRVHFACHKESPRTFNAHCVSVLCTN